MRLVVIRHAADIRASEGFSEMVEVLASDQGDPNRLRHLTRRASHVSALNLARACAWSISQDGQDCVIDDRIDEQQEWWIGFP